MSELEKAHDEPKPKPSPTASPHSDNDLPGYDASEIQPTPRSSQSPEAADMPHENYGTIQSPSADPRPRLEAQLEGSSRTRSRSPRPGRGRKGSPARNDGGVRRRTGGFLVGLRTKVNPAPALENKGNTARDHLANERTWLAYVRTSLAIASAGVALVQLFSISTTSNPSGAQKLRRLIRPLGGAVVMVGLAVLAIGTWRYFLIQRALQQNEFPPARRSVGLLTAALLAIVGVTFGFLVGVHR